MAKTTCPACQANISLEGKLEIGTTINCGECREPLEIVWLFPLTVGFQQEETLDQRHPKLKSKPKLRSW